MADVNDYGIKVSRAGFPVLTASDRQLLYSSSFPTLPIAFTGTLNDGSTFAHNLGYFPPYFFIQQQSSGDFFDNSGKVFGADGVRIDTTTLYNNLGVSIIYYIMAYNLRTSYTASNIDTTDATGGSTPQDYGFKVSKDGQDVLTAGHTNLNIFSGLSVGGQPVRQVIIHQTGFADNLAAGNTTNISHNLGYVPLFLFFYRINGNTPYKYWFSSYTVNGDLSVTLNLQPTISSTQLTIYNNTGSAIDYAYIILKDNFS